MIDRIYQTVKTLLNTDGYGNVKPSEFDLILHNVVTEKFETLFFEVNKLINRQNRGLINGGLENITDNVREKIEHYITPYTALTYSGTTFTLPADLRYFDTILYNSTIVEMLKSNREFEIVKSQDPLATEPIGLKQGNTIKIYPSTIITNVTMSYIRNPNQAKWTYSIVNNVEIFNPSAGDYVDVDIHPSEEDDIIEKVVNKFAMNLKERDVYLATQQEEALEFNQENSS